MEERGIGVVVVIAIVIVVVAVVGLSSYYLFTRGPSETSIPDITLHPAQYMGKQIEVKGMVQVIQVGVAMLVDPGTGSFIFLTNLPENFTSIAAYYRVRGTVTTYQQSSLALDVTDIRLAD